MNEYFLKLIDEVNKNTFNLNTISYSTYGSASNLHRAIPGTAWIVKLAMPQFPLPSQALRPIKYIPCPTRKPKIHLYILRRAICKQIFTNLFK